MARDARSTRPSRLPPSRGSSTGGDHPPRPSRHLHCGPSSRVVLRCDEMSADTALRANVRLLGDLLGRVLVEQEGQDLLDDEERIRALARVARAGGSRVALSEAVAALGLERQAAVQRSFALFFQLVNIAEQHHRIRRRREYEAEGRVQRESLADAFAQLERSGVDTDALAAAGGRLRVELVLTAHPTEATRRTVLEAHRRVAALLA